MGRRLYEWNSPYPNGHKHDWSNAHTLFKTYLTVSKRFQNAMTAFMEPEHWELVFVMYKFVVPADPQKRRHTAYWKGATDFGVYRHKHAEGIRLIIGFSGMPDAVVVPAVLVDNIPRPDDSIESQIKSYDLLNAVYETVLAAYSAGYSEACGEWAHAKRHGKIRSRRNGKVSMTLRLSDSSTLESEFKPALRVDRRLLTP